MKTLLISILLALPLLAQQPVSVSNTPLPVSGTVTSNQGGAPWTATGTKTGNNAAPSSTNLGVIDCLANASAPTWTEGNLVFTSCDLAGNIRVLIVGTVTVAGTITANQGGTWTVQPGNTANTTAWKVDGSAVTQPVSGTVTANATLAAETTKVIGTVRAQGNLGAAFDGPTGSAPPANGVLTVGLGSGATGGDVLAVPIGDTYKPVNISTATTTLLITGVASRQVRITALHLLNNAADSVALIEGTGATCGTGTAGMAGGTTAASGYNLIANGGLTLGHGVGTVIQTVTAGDSVCAVTSAATQLSGGIEYAIY